MRSVRARLVGIIAAGALAACSSGAGAPIHAGPHSATSGSASTTTPSPFPTDTIIYTPDPSLPQVSFPSTGVTDAPSGAVAISLSTSDTAAISNAYTSFTALAQLWGGPPYTSVPCPIEVVPGTFRAAVITVSGVRWAFGRLRPKPSCMLGSGASRIDPNKAYPFGTGSAASSGVFETTPGGTWMMNYFESFPFPCPDNPGAPQGNPGPGRPLVPLAVLNAVGVPYASGCGNVYIPPAPR